MPDFYNEKQALSTLIESINTTLDAMNLDKIKLEISKIKETQSNPDYWLEVSKSSADNRTLSLLEKKLETSTDLLEKTKYISELISLSEEIDDDSSIEEIRSLLVELSVNANAVFLETLLNGKYDSLNAILSLHAGAGGTEAQDWVEMLYRMYLRYCERAGYKTSVLEYLEGDEAGIKSITFMCTGKNAYGFLKAEKGVHRLVRISPFDANKKRHTSFASLEVMPEIIDDAEIKILPEDLRIDTLKSSGAGGQHINKTESAIRITHIPTGFVVNCQNERSQIQNRETAMKMLRSKLIEKKEREQMEINQSIKGELKKIEWGSQIRSYVFCPYTLVKDHRTGFENTNVTAVMDGDIADFIYAYLSKI
ncbi:MAG: peptide chain release factor 2 [Christensenellaceae bacterium]|jgi:peptide chain release factor 2|nr:peptide chain release factor 2 [Christensenellaceae bacterium]